MQKYKLDRRVWSQDDFEVMGWHDANIYGMIIEKGEEPWQTNLLFDIDYIFEWVNPIPPQECFSFWVAPCTLIFKEVFDLKIDVDFSSRSLNSLEISDLLLISKTEQENNFCIYEWMIELQEGRIHFKSLGFEQMIRKKPIHVNSQVLNIDERGGISFSRETFKEK